MIKYFFEQYKIYFKLYNYAQAFSGVNLVSHKKEKCRAK